VGKLLALHFVSTSTSESTIGKTSQSVQVVKKPIEACHAKVRKFFENHPNYNFKDKSGERYGKALLAAIIHFNSNNLGSVN